MKNHGAHKIVLDEVLHCVQADCIDLLPSEIRVHHECGSRRTQTLLKDGVDYVGLLGAVYNKPVASGIAGVRRAGIRPIIVLRIFTVFEHSIDRISAAIGHLKNLRDVGDTLGPLVARRAAKKLIVE